MQSFRSSGVPSPHESTSLARSPARDSRDSTMHRRIAYVTLAALAGCAAFEGEEEPVTNVTVHVGERRLDGDWDAVDQQPTAGVQVDRHDPSAAIGYEFGLFISSDRGERLDPGPDNLGGDFELSGMATDLSVGLRKTFSRRDVHSYIGAGVAYTHAAIEVDPPHGDAEEETDDSLGFYAHAGFYWSILQNSLFGLDYRVITGTDTDLGLAEDSDSSVVSLFFGYSF